jgi:thioredoxin reductase
MKYDVVIVGGGPAGLAAALALGRARKQVLVCDSGPRRNAAAKNIHNFVTRDGTPPDEFRQIGRQQLAIYPKVDVRDVRVESITGSRGAFSITLSTETVEARRILLCTGMLDEMLPIEGFRELWGQSIYQCPYCHGWEAQDRPWGYLALPSTLSHLLPFVLQARGWTPDLTVFTNGLAIPDDALSQLQAARIRVETTAISRLVARDQHLESIVLDDGRALPCESLFVHPPQRQVDLVRKLDLSLDDDGFVKTDPMKRETSVPGIFAAGDLTSRMQAAIVAAGAGMQAAAMINVELTTELVMSGAL